MHDDIRGLLIVVHSLVEQVGNVILDSLEARALGEEISVEGIPLLLKILTSRLTEPPLVFLASWPPE